MDDSKNKNSYERCVLCLDEKSSPVLIQCGHSFCYGCLDVYKSYKKYPWANKCPICRNVLKEKKKGTKRKHAEQTADSPTATITSMTQTHNHSNSSVTPQQQTNIFEEYMELAASYDFDGNDYDTSFNVYENLVGTAQNSIYYDEEYDTYYDEEDYENQLDSDLENSYRDEVDYYADSDEYNDGQDLDETDHDYNYFEETDDNDYGYFDENTQRHYDDESHETSFINVVDTVAYEIDSLMPRDQNNNFNGNSFYGDIDWETVIASDVIIIE